MDSKAKRLINMVLKNEGGYANVKGDNGGETYRGITRKNFPNWSGWKIVDKYKPLKNNQIIKSTQLENDVLDFYYDEFYLPMKINKIDSLMISGHLLCHGVNAGIKNSVKLLQKAINITYSVSISMDGIIGTNTLKYANGSKKSKLANNFIEQRKQYYQNIVKKTPSQKKFLKGWLNRINETTKDCSSSTVSLFTSFSSDSSSNNLIIKIIKFIMGMIHQMTQR